MATFEKKLWSDRVSQFPTRRTITHEDNSSEMITVTRNEGQVTNPGDAFNAQNMNDLEDRIEDVVEEMNTNFQAGVDAVYNACVAEGVTPATSTPAGIAQAIASIRAGGDAQPAEILYGKKAYSGRTLKTGTMTNRGAVSQSLNCGGSYTIPTGYHNGSGKVTANSLASQTSATAQAGHIFTGYTAWVNGSKITGTMANQGAKTATINPGGSYTIPAGYHNGSGKVTANPNQNSGTYTCPANWSGTPVTNGNGDMGANNTQRYVNATNVYNYGRTQGQKDQHNIVCVVNVAYAHGDTNYVDVSLRWKFQGEADSAYRTKWSATMKARESYSLFNASTSYTYGLS